MNDSGRRVNEFEQTIGPDIGEWSGAIVPGGTSLAGRYATLDPLRPEHAAPLYESLRAAPESLWTYMHIGPFTDVAAFTASVEALATLPGWVAYAIKANGRYVGFACYLRIDAAGGAIEIGSIVFSPLLQRTRAATEAIYLMVQYAFELGYRRVEWKCDDLNGASRRAAERFGFTYEGTFRKATHYKGRSRDTAWYAIVDTDWPRIAESFEAWLAPENFDSSGRQRERLAARA